MLKDINTSILRSWWTKNSAVVMYIAILLMACIATIWLSYEFWRLLWQPDPLGAIDLKQRHNEVDFWFSHKKVYGRLVTATYPPATYALLWPFLGWLEVTTARFFWAITTVFSLAWLLWLFLKESSADTRLERFFVGLIPLSMYATGATIGNGQLIVHIMPFLLTGLFILQQSSSGWRNDLIASFLMVVALMKPSVSAPFFWIILFVPGRLRPALLIVCGYVTVTILSVTFQDLGTFSVLKAWMASAGRVISDGAVKYSMCNLHSLLYYLNLEKWLTPLSVIFLLYLGLWVFRNRSKDLWLLIGVTALVARFWTYHAWYDDLLVKVVNYW